MSQKEYSHQHRRDILRNYTDHKWDSWLDRNCKSRQNYWGSTPKYKICNQHLRSSQHSSADSCNSSYHWRNIHCYIAMQIQHLNILLRTIFRIAYMTHQIGLRMGLCMKYSLCSKCSLNKIIRRPGIADCLKKSLRSTVKRRLCIECLRNMSRNCLGMAEMRLLIQAILVRKLGILWNMISFYNVCLSLPQI